MIFQDNGIGNMLTALLTFPQPYHLPLFGIITRRGGLGEYNSMIHTISERSEALLDGGRRALVPARRAHADRGLVADYPARLRSSRTRRTGRCSCWSI